MPSSSPGKHRSSDSSSRGDAFWYGGREADDGKRQNRGWPESGADHRVLVTEIPEKRRYREGDAESLIGDV